MKKKCLWCGREFKTKNENRKYCSKHKEVPCYNCGKLFEPTPYQKGEIILYGNDRVYCSKECRDKCSTEKHKQTMTEKYGVDSVFKVQEFKDKSTKTIFEKYGVDNVAKNEKVVNKRKQTCLKKYGYTSASKSKQVQDKIKNTMINRYGVPYAMQSNEIVNKYKDNYYNNIKNEEYKQKMDNRIKKIKQTKLDRYGDENYNNIEKVKETCLKRYNRQWAVQRYTPIETLNMFNNENKLREYLNNIPYKDRTYEYICNKLKISDDRFKYYMWQVCNIYDIPIKTNKHKQQTDLYKWLKTIYTGSIILDTKRVIKPYELDIYIPDKKVAIEFNGTFYHNSTYTPYSKIGIDKNYHYNKSKLCEEKGVRLIHIFEYEWNNPRQRPILENIIKNALGINDKRIYARKCKVIVKQSKQMRKFFDDNNIQGFRGGKFAICLEYHNEIVMSYMMGHPYFGKGKYEWEVIRGATKLGYTIVGGASKIFNYFINHYNPKNCVYYIDYNYFNGNSLKYLPHMKYIKTQPSFKNYFVDQNIVKNRDPNHHKEITQLYKQGKVLQIWNAGTKVYIWHDKDV